LAVLMFLAAFVPLVGALLAGALAILVVLAAKGWVLALVVLGVLIVMNQLESHLLQPQVVGKMVHLHPLAVILVLAVGGVVAGIFGAVIAVPLTAAVTRALPELRRSGHPRPDVAYSLLGTSPKGGGLCTMPTVPTCLSRASTRLPRCRRTRSRRTLARTS
jgi:predicted PurR-regulated permease PerM